MTLAFLKTGPNDGKLSPVDNANAFKGHFANMEDMSRDRRLLVAGPFGASKHDRNLRGIFIECSWTDDDLAELTGHMSPNLLKRDIAKLGGKQVPIYVTHRKPGFEKDVEAALRATGDERLVFVRDGDVFEL